MNSIIIYDSLYGNTKKVAQAMAETLKCDAVSVNNASLADISKSGLVVFGCPTHAGRPSEPMKKFLDALPAGALKGKRFAAFDTRMSPAGKNFLVRGIIGFFGFAAPHLSKQLHKLGGESAAEPAGFVVAAKEGPLADGELERAVVWAKGLTNH